MRGQNFAGEDNLHTGRFNQALWAGLKGEDQPYPFNRHGRDLRENRQVPLKRHQVNLRQDCASSS